MREIKFRGKRIDNGEWVYGWIYGDKVKAIITLIKNNQMNEVETFDTSRVIPETVSQYTGLKDKNGVEIYEGYILRNADNPFVDKLPFKVEWNEYYGAWFWWSLLGEVGTDHLYQNIAKDCEVIGNIYDNPELMEVSNG